MHMSGNAMRLNRCCHQVLGAKKAELAAIRRQEHGRTDSNLDYKARLALGLS